LASEHHEQVFPHLPHIPFDPNIGLYDCAGWHMHQAHPLEFTGWRDEILSWRTSVGLGAVLNPTPTSFLRGPDVIRFLSDICVNSFAAFPVGSAKHAIMCNDDGLVMVHGMVLRTAEDEVCTMWLSPWPDYQLARAGGRYDVEAEDQTMERFMFQVAGPRSLETLEAASGDDLHDIRFIRHRLSSIDGRQVRVLRIGMAGGLGYEVHGRFEDAIPVYNSILEAGKPFGIRRMGMKAYMLNHTESGFPQWGYHFPAPWSEDEEFGGFLEAMGAALLAEPVAPRGSAGPDLSKRYRNPIELGWGHMVKFDHEFIGREALERVAEAASRQTVTLEWNKQDILDVHASQWEPGEPYLPMDEPSQFSFWPTPGKTEGEDQAPGQWGDEVRSATGEVVGISTGRTYSALFRETLSLAVVDVAHAEEGTELIVIWGEPGTRQKEIRARVARFPYLNESRNEHVDVSTIPALGGMPMG
jgi:glycine cleavage system aminomethyltransferase T